MNETSKDENENIHDKRVGKIHSTRCRMLHLCYCIQENNALPFIGIYWQWTQCEIKFPILKLLVYLIYNLHHIINRLYDA